MTLDQLQKSRCKPLKGAEHALTRAAATDMLDALPGWILAENAHSIGKDFTFKGFNKTMSFVNAVAWIANQQNHHPDMEVGFGHCCVRFSTHDVGGLSMNDLICAAKVEALLSDG